MWLNIHPFVFRHGVMLEDLPPATRQLGLGLLEACLSARGFAQARDIMRLNRLLAEVTGLTDDFGEWPYFLSFYGEPSAERPWAWQIDGHHLCLNGTVIGDQFLLTPGFMGSEPCRGVRRSAGRHDGLHRSRSGLAWISSARLMTGRRPRLSCGRRSIPMTSPWSCRTPSTAGSRPVRAGGQRCGCLCGCLRR